MSVKLLSRNKLPYLLNSQKIFSHVQVIYVRVRFPNPFLYASQSLWKDTSPPLRLWNTVQPPSESISQYTWAGRHACRHTQHVRVLDVLHWARLYGNLEKNKVYYVADKLDVTEMSLNFRIKLNHFIMYYVSPNWRYTFYFKCFKISVKIEWHVGCVFNSVLIPLLHRLQDEQYQILFYFGKVPVRAFKI